MVDPQNRTLTTKQSVIQFSNTMSHTKKIIVFAGPSGVGKSTLANMLIHHSDKCEFSVSATTRPIRLGEQHGQNYYFFSKDEFQSRIENGDFLEWEEVYPGVLYGTLQSEVARITSLGKIAIFDIDVLGAINIKEQFGDEAHLIFVKPESMKALEERLRQLGTDSEEQIQARIARFEKELGYEDKFDQVIVNETGRIDAAKEQVLIIANTYCS